MTARVAELTFGILRERRATAVSVTDDQVMAAMRWAHAEHGLTVEPGGAAGLAAVMTGKAPIEDSVVVLSGGNVDPALFARTIA